MNNAPKISVLIPAYNCEQYIEQCVNSILEQDFPDLELVICDDGSTDNTFKKLEGFNDNRIRLLKNEVNKGNVYTFNRLLSEAKGEYIALQDADDWSDRSRLSKQLDHLRCNPKLTACYTQMYKTDLEGKVIFTTEYPLESKNIERFMPLHFHVVCASILFKRELIDTIGNYPEYFRETGGADWYWTYRLFEKFKAENLSEAMYYYRTNPDSITQARTDNFRKFFISDLLQFLIKQRKNHGTDALENEKFKSALEKFEEKLKRRFDNDPIIQQKREYVNARLAGDKELRTRAYKEMMDISSFKTLLWFVQKPFSMLYNKIRISLT